MKKILLVCLVSTLSFCKSRNYDSSEVLTEGQTATSACYFTEPGYTGKICTHTLITTGNEGLLELSGTAGSGKFKWKKHKGTLTLQNESGKICARGMRLEIDGMRLISPSGSDCVKSGTYDIITNNYVMVFKNKAQIYVGAKKTKDLTCTEDNISTESETGATIYSFSCQNGTTQLSSRVGGQFQKTLIREGSGHPIFEGKCQFVDAGELRFICRDGEGR